MSGINFPKPVRFWKPDGFFYAVLFFAGINSLFSQPRTLTVLSAKDHSPVADASIVFHHVHPQGTKKDRAFAVTKADGTAVVPFSSDVTATITHLGFAGTTDTLRASESKTVYLQPLNVTIEEVVVTAQYTPDDPANSVYPVHVIRREAIENKGATNLSEALRQESNIRISQDNILGSTLTLQGLSGGQIKILVDNVPVIGRENGNIDLSQINLSHAKRIEIIEGPVSVQYGTNAMAGVINIITNHSRHHGMSARLNGCYESVGVYNADAGVGFGRNRHSAELSGGRNFFDGYSAADTSRFKEWKPKEQYFGTLKYGYGFRRLRFTAKGDAFYEKVTNRRKPLPPYYITAFDDYYYTQRSSGAASLSGEILQNHFLDVVVAYSWYSRIKNTFYKDLVTLEKTMTANEGDQDTTRFRSWLVRGFASRNKPNKIFNYQTGYDVSIEQGKGGKIDDGSRMIADYALFASFNFKPAKNLTLQAGMRWTYNTHTDYRTPVTPAFNLKWSPGRLVIRASYARGFRTPSLKEMYLDFVDVNHDIHGNPELREEYSHNASFRLDYSRKVNNHHFAIAPSCYFNAVKDLIKLAETGNRMYTYWNIESYMTLGTLLDLEYSYGDFKVKASWGNSGQRKDANMNFDYSPEVSLQASYLIPKALVTISVFNKFNGQQTTYVLDEVATVFEKATEAYNMLDISLNRHFWNKRISLTAGVKNIMNVNNVTSMGGGGIHSGPGDTVSIAWGRSFFASLKLVFEKNNKHWI